MEKSRSEMMTNLEHLKREINSENLCDKLNCSECPMFPNNKEFKKPCFKRLKEWCLKEYKKEGK